MLSVSWGGKRHNVCIDRSAFGKGVVRGFRGGRTMKRTDDRTQAATKTLCLS